jgi:hypothetical protein
VAKSDRQKRPKPARAGPVRGATAEPQGSSNGDGRYSYRRAVDQTLKTAWMVAEAVDTTTRGAVERGVETAYAVIDEYIRRGQAAAGRHHHTNNSGGSMNQPPYSRNSYGSGPNPWSQMNPLMAPWMQAMQMWTNSMMAFMPTNAANNPMAAWASAWTGAGSAPHPEIAVRASSTQPVEVTVTLDAGADLTRLGADPLTNAENPKAPKIVGTTVESAPGRVRVRITVPDDQPLGHYAGALRDPTGVARGGLCIEVGATTST